MLLHTPVFRGPYKTKVNRVVNEVFDVPYSKSQYFLGIDQGPQTWVFEPEM
jgi:hypothetical protein